MKKGGDWAYITFPNGVPTVQDIKTNVGPVSLKEVVPIRPVASPTTSAMLVPGKTDHLYFSHPMKHVETKIDEKNANQVFFSVTLRPFHISQPH